VQTLQVLTVPMAIALENARYVAEQLALTKQLAEQSVRAQLAEESLHAVTHDLQLALRASKAGTWNWQIDSKRVTWDAANYALFGLKPEEFKGTLEAVLERIHQADRELARKAIECCIEQDTPYYMEYRVIWPDNSEHWIAAQGQVYRDKDDKPIKMAGVCLDITQRKQLERERQEALKKADEARIRQEEAQRYQQKQKEFTETICHELRNPLQGLTGGTGFLRDEITSLKVALNQPKVESELKTQLEAKANACQESLSDIEACAEHLNSLLNDVLNLSKLEAQKLELDLQAIQPKALINSVVKIFKARFAAEQLQLETQLPAEDIIVKGDALRLKEILINLLANALKFTERGGVTIGLKVLSATATQTRLQFTVRDTGIGMTKEQQSRVFQRFAQASARIAGEYGGTGLGLEISDKLVKLMGGQIAVESEVGQGSQFSFTLEFTKPTPEEVKAITQPPEEAKEAAIVPPAEPSIRPVGLTLFPPAKPSMPTVIKPQERKILLVDDDSTIRKILARHLTNLGYQALVMASNGQEAIEGFVKAVEEESPFSLIFMDVTMPGMSGYEATQQIRQKEQASKREAIPIIGCTGHADEDAKQQALAAGMNDVIVKPFKKEGVERMVSQWLAALPAESTAKEAVHSPS
jgi:PAS domain S-box-containing protein